MSFLSITSMLKPALEAMNALIQRSLRSDVPEIELIAQHLIESGGKRIRPIVTLLSAKACGFAGDAAIEMATIIEFIHSATLLHDDVVDNSSMRRGRPTANYVWDNPSAVLVGDFLYSRAFQMMVKLGNLSALAILADATNAIAEGEVMQLKHRFAPDVSEARYYQVIGLKTATLFAAAAELGAVLAGHANAMWQVPLRRYGQHIGTAFQLVDDILDYQAEPGILGKNQGDDLAEGKVTLPLLYTLAQADDAEARYLREAIISGSVDDLPRIQESIVSSGAIDYTVRRAKQEAENAVVAIEELPDSAYKAAMIDLAAFSVQRNM